MHKYGSHLMTMIIMNICKQPASLSCDCWMTQFSFTYNYYHVGDIYALIPWILAIFMLIM